MKQKKNKEKKKLNKRTHFLILMDRIRNLHKQQPSILILQIIQNLLIKLMIKIAPLIISKIYLNH
jgi:hypothetical protein